MSNKLLFPNIIYIRNNILYNAKRSIYAVEDNVNGFIELDYNVIYQPFPSDTLFVSFPSFTLYQYSNFNTYTTTTQKDLNSLTGNPDFVDLNGSDFKISTSSIAIDVGTNLNIFEDFEGNLRPYNGVFDIGAYEFSGPLEISNNESFESVIAYPSPASNAFRVKLKSQEPYTLKLYNLRGQETMTVENYFSNEKIKINQIENGIYWFSLSSDIRIIGTGKIIIQKE